MNDNLQPFGNEQIEARITAWVLGEASPFEASELEALCTADLELQLFLNRTKALNTLLLEAESTVSDLSWKLPAAKRNKLADILGAVPVLIPLKESRIRRASFRAAWGIAAVFVVTFFSLRLLPGEYESDLALLEQMKIKLMTEEIVGDLPNETIIVHDDPVIIDRKFPSNPIAALKKVFAPDTKSSGPLATAKVEELQVPLPLAVEGEGNLGELDSLAALAGRKSDNGRIDKKQINFEGSTHTKDKMIRREVPDQPSSSNARVIAANTLSTGQIPVPESPVVAPSADFGDGDDLGAGGGGGALANRGVKRKPSAPVESAIRSGDTSITRDSIDGILNHPEPVVSAGKPAAPTSEMSNPADHQEAVEGKAKEGADLFAEFNEPEEIASFPELVSKGKNASLADRFETYTGVYNNADRPTGLESYFQSNVRAGSERADLTGTVSGGFKMDLADHVTGFTGDKDFDGFANYGAPIAGEPKQVDITTKHTEITQANDAELGFDWIIPLENKKDGETDPFWDTSEAAAKAEGKGGVEYEIHTGYNSEYLFRRHDLSEKQKPIDLADLSEEISATQEPFSTFSLNISDASFQLALAAVEKGERPDPASIKPEQFYNAVDYGDPAPSSLEPVAAAIDQTAHPVIPGRNLVRVAIRTASTGRSAAQPLRLTLLVDQSGSMARADRRAAMDAALAQLATLLTENDQVTVIGFSRTPRLIADALPGNEAAKLPDLINPTASEGGTNLEQALNLSSKLALRHKLDGAQNRIVLFTDGAANLGDADPARLAGRVKELRQQGLAFDIAGIGTTDTNDRLLSELARHGNGRYYLVGENTGASLAAQLAGAFRPAAENVKVQVKLNPERVGNYKLIGFEKDRLKTEDFHDDSVDAAELAADEAGVAIYQVETLPEGTGEIGEVSVRFRDTASGEMVERAWTIPHDPTTPAFDKADPKTQLATLALLAAQKLQGGPLADAIRFPDLAETIAKLKQTYANDAKAQRLLTLVNALR